VSSLLFSPARNERETQRASIAYLLARAPLLLLSTHYYHHTPRLLLTIIIIIIIILHIFPFILDLDFF
jgi:hypothetical protein